MPKLPVAAKLPPALGLCFAPFSDDRFVLPERSEARFLDLSHNRTVGQLITFAQAQAPFRPPAAPHRFASFALAPRR